MFKGVVMVNIYEEQLKQLINTSSQLDRFFILDKDGNFLLQGGAQTAQLSLEDKDLLVSRLEQSPDNAYRGDVYKRQGQSIPLIHTAYSIQIPRRDPWIWPPGFPRPPEG